MSETAQDRLRRLRMRSWRRGMKETDLILGRYADATLETLGDEALDAWEALLGENDQDIFAWVTEAADPPGNHAALVARLREFVARAKGLQT